MTDRARFTEGIHHAGLTVPNLTATRDFFIEALGFNEVGAVPDYPAVFLSDGTIEFDPEPLGAGASRHLMCAIPGGVRVEFIAPAAA